MDNVFEELSFGESFDIIKSQAGFEIVPCDETLDLTDQSKFSKLELSSGQKMQVSALTQQMPATLASGTLAKSYRVSFPDGVPHTLTRLKQGGFGSMVRDTNGKFIGSASFYSTAAQAAALGAFSAMSAASGQYFLTQINNELKLVNTQIDKILEFLYGDKKAELMSEISFVQFAYKNYSSIMSHEDQRVATISGIQEARKIAMKDVEFYLNDLDSTIKSEAKSYLDIKKNLEKAVQIKDSLEMSEQLYVMGNILEMYFAQNTDETYIKFLEETMTAYVSKCNNYVSSYFSTLKGQITGYKPKTPLEKVNKAPEEEKVDEIIEPLKRGEESIMHKAIHTALHSFEKKKDYYIDTKGNVYLKAI